MKVNLFGKVKEVFGGSMDIRDIETIVFDIDGTLVDRDGEILDKTKKAIIDVQNKGVHIILASGRPFKSMLSLAKELELDKHKGIILCNNGAMAYDTKNSKVIFETPIDHDLILEILKKIDGRPISPMIEDGDSYLVKDIDSGFIYLDGKRMDIIRREAKFGDYGIKEVSPMEDYVDHNINKLLTIVAPEDVQKTIEEFKEIFGDKLHVVQTSPFFMEFVMPQVSKSYGLEKLGIKHDSLMAFGDSMNDKEMLEYAKYPIAMGNALDPVKDIAYYITDDNNHDGIYKALKKFGFIDW